MTYLGSKAASGVFQKIIAEMPPHDTYIETHTGGGAVMLRKPPARRNWGIDIDPLTVEAFCGAMLISLITWAIAFYRCCRCGAVFKGLRFFLCRSCAGLRGPSLFA